MKTALFDDHFLVLLLVLVRVGLLVHVRVGVHVCVLLLVRVCVLLRVLILVRVRLLVCILALPRPASPTISSLMITMPMHTMISYDDNDDAVDDNNHAKREDAPDYCFQLVQASRKLQSFALRLGNSPLGFSHSAYLSVSEL